jgi:hypothetical protein
MADLHARVPQRRRAKARRHTGGESALPPPPQPAPAQRRPVDLIARAKEQLRSLTGYGVDNVSGFAKVDGGWQLSLTVVELHRIPPITDMLASYKVDLDEAGDIVSYRRSKRYFRDQVGDET